MDLFVGLDVSKDTTAICARRGDGSIVLACKSETEPVVIASALFALDGKLSCVVLETGRMANWLYDELSELGIPIVCIDARQAHAVLSQMHNKTDENDAAMLAELARTGFYKQVAVKSRQGQERRALLRAREVAMKTRMNLENTIRGLLSSFGVRLPKHPRTFAGRVLAAIEGAASLDAIIRPLVMIRADAMRGLAELDKALRRAARDDEAARRLMSIPGVGAVSAFAFVATIDDPTRFRSSRSVGAYLGLSAKRHQSGERDISGRITKRGDRMMRTILYEAANSLLTRVRSGKGAALQKWAHALKARSSHKKAVVALARKLAVIMHRLWIDGTTFDSNVA